MLFSAEISDFKTIHNVLRAMTFKEHVIVKCLEEGLQFTLEEMRSVETSAYIPVNLFSSYQLQDLASNLIFKISMKALTECLSIFGDDDNPSIKFSYKAQGDPLLLLMKHSIENVTIDCELSTFSVDDDNDISLADECNLNSVILDGPTFHEILLRLDNWSDDICFEFLDDPTGLTLTTQGIAGESSKVIPKHSVSLFKCTRPTTTFYSFANIRQILKVMHYASQVIISTADSGLLRLQLTINLSENNMYVEYFVTSQISV